MVKAKDFWRYFCGVLGYRFFAGVPCKGLRPLFDKMDSKFMHYIPAVNEQISIGLVNGAYIANVNSAVLMSSAKIDKLNLDFNIHNLIPLLIIASGNSKPKFQKEIYSLELTDDLEGCLNRITGHIISRGKPGVLFIREGVLQ